MTEVNVLASHSRFDIYDDVVVDDDEDDDDDYCEAFCWLWWCDDYDFDDDNEGREKE